MPNINLLPWREELREERKKQFISLLVCVLAVAALLGFFWTYLENAQVENQRERNKLLQTEIKKLEQQVAEIKKLKEDKEELVDRMEVIKSLQSGRPEIVKLFDQYVRVMPDGVYIDGLSKTGNQMKFSGKAESNNRVSAYMRRLDQSPKFTNPNLTQVTADQTLGDQGSQFSMTVDVLSTAVEDEGEE